MTDMHAGAATPGAALFSGRISESVTVTGHAI